MIWRVMFLARKDGAIGIFTHKTIEVEAKNYEEAAAVSWKKMKDDGYEINGQWMPTRVEVSEGV